ncbi:MAG: hypothetical protein UIM26_07640 [Longicatena sp.]|nr:hypothetical protein [Longicatena sp.]
MAVANRIPVGELKVANTSNVKEMKNGRPMNVKLNEAGLENCVIVTLAAQPVDNGENDHVFVGTVLAASAVADAVEAGTAYLVVAPEIMVEEARMTDGHIGKFRFEQGGVYTAYQLQPHDRIEVSSTHRYASGAGKVISTRPMATGVIVDPAGALYEGSKLSMIKIEF